MATAEPRADAAPSGARRPGSSGADTGARASAGARRWAWGGLALVLLGGLGLRLWGVRQGLPYAYNADEYDHFVVHAIEMFEHGTLNPHYFANPPAFTYVLHFLFAAWYGGAHGAVRAFQLHPTAVYTLARVAAALLGTLALWLLYLTGARLFDRAVGLLAAAIEAVAFLAVFYAHLALNDAPTLAPATLSLLGAAGVLRKGRARDHLLAGVGLGLACASKYTAGIVLVPLLAAIVARGLEQQGARGRIGHALGGLALAGASALAAFAIANPYALLDYGAFHGELVHQSTLSAEAQGKLGAPKEGGLVYYLWSFTWGLGWLPSLAALAGAVLVWRRERRLGWLLVPAGVLFLAFMGTEGRYFGRWLLPIFPIACLLAAFFVVSLARRAAELIERRAERAGGRAGNGRDGAPRGRAAGPRRGALARLIAALPVAAVLAQGLLYSIHSGIVLSRADTRNLTRAWMLAHIPRGAGIVAEPAEPEEWAREVIAGEPTAASPFRWRLYPALFRRVTAAGRIAPEYLKPEVGLEDYETTLYPALIVFYEREAFCWVISASTESGRAFADPREVRNAVAYYRALARAGEVVYRASPYARGHGPVAFNFDWSFDYYPLAYDRPGPEMTIYRLRGGRCAGASHAGARARG
ncbi:MAG TPA: glycosyltransferase family 39 protein [Solirubrobacteraceae bacterium]|nr:glycosyltransferase family 39 protein [Solirubrobacteraceae bacterium]